MLKLWEVDIFRMPDTESALLIMRRIETYVDDVQHILRHEIVDDEQKYEISQYIGRIENQMWRITKYLYPLGK